LLQWFEYEQHLCRAGDICPGGAFGAEFAVLPDRVREELEKLHDIQRQWMRATLETGRRLGEIRAEGRVEDQAEMVLAALQGGLKIARASRDPAAFDGMLEQLKVTLFT
jgi:hypothetical protein